MKTEESNPPLVGISCITYKQASFLRDMLEGIAMQKTDFPFVAVVGNDCSPDNTAEILEEYRSRYPHIFRIINQEVNQGALENSLIVLDHMPPVRYLAFCEGDDYWTDPLKLQKQVDLMESHPECSICFHMSAVKYENGGLQDETVPDREILEKLTPCVDPDLLLSNNIIPTASVLYRRKYTAEEFRKIYKSDMIPGDWFWHLAHMRFGTIHFIPETMSVYRKHDLGMFSSLDQHRDLFFKKYSIQHCRFFEEALKLFDQDSHEYKMLRKRFCDFFLECMISLVKKNDFETVERFIKVFNSESIEKMLIHKHSGSTLASMIRTVYLYCSPSDSLWEKCGKYFLRIWLKIRDDGLWKSIKRVFK